MTEPRIREHLLHDHLAQPGRRRAIRRRERTLLAPRIGEVTTVDRIEAERIDERRDERLTARVVTGDRKRNAVRRALRSAALDEASSIDARVSGSVAPPWTCGARARNMREAP